MASPQASLRSSCILLLLIGVAGPCALAGRVSNRVTWSSSVRTQLTGSSARRQVKAVEPKTAHNRRVQADYRAAQHLGHQRPRDEHIITTAEKKHSITKAGLHYTLYSSVATYAEAVATCLEHGASLGGSMWPPDQEAMSALCNLDEGSAAVIEGCWLLSPATKTGPNSLCRAWQPEANLVDVPCSTRRQFVCVTSDPATGVSSEDYDYYRVDDEEQQTDTAAVSNAAPTIGAQEPTGTVAPLTETGTHHALQAFKSEGYHYALQSPAGYADAVLLCSMQGMWLAGSRWPDDIAALEYLCMNTQSSPNGCWLEPQPDSLDNQCSYTTTFSQVEVCDCDVPRSFVCARHRDSNQQAAAAATDNYEDYYSFSPQYEHLYIVEEFVDWDAVDSPKDDAPETDSSSSNVNAKAAEAESDYESWSAVVDYWEDGYEVGMPVQASSKQTTAAVRTGRLPAAMDVYEIANLVYAKLPHKMPYAEAQRACDIMNMQPAGSQDMYDQVALHMLCTEEKGVLDGCWHAANPEEGEQTTCLAQKGIHEAVEVDCMQPHAVLCVAVTPYFHDSESQLDYDRISYTEEEEDANAVAEDGMRPLLAAADAAQIGMDAAVMDNVLEAETRTAADAQQQPAHDDSGSMLSSDTTAGKREDVDGPYSQEYHDLETETVQHANSMINYVGNMLASTDAMQAQRKSSVLVPGRQPGAAVHHAMAAHVRGTAATVSAGQQVAGNFPQNRRQEGHATRELPDQQQTQQGKRQQTTSVLVLAQADDHEARSVHAPTSTLVVLHQAQPHDVAMHGHSALQLLDDAMQLVQSGKQAVSALLGTAKDALLKELASVPVVRFRRALLSHSRTLLTEDSLQEFSLEASNTELSLSQAIITPGGQTVSPSPSDQPSPLPSPDQSSPAASPEQPSPPPEEQSPASEPAPSPDEASPSPEPSPSPSPLPLEQDVLPPDSPFPSPQATPSPQQGQAPPASPLDVQAGGQQFSSVDTSSKSTDSQSGNVITDPGSKDGGRVVSGWVPALGAVAGLMLVAMLGAAVYVYAKRGGGGYQPYAEVELMGDFGQNGSAAQIQSARTTYTRF